MKHNVLKRLGASTALALACGLAFAQSTEAPMSKSMGQGSQQMHEQMMSGMQKMQSMQPGGDTDKDFAMMMRMHHQTAIDMAKVEVEQGKSSEMKALARKIISDQQKEIAQLDKWLATKK
ncbi:MAG TPA: DUF305 domain-containing protein [Methylibium sp.]|uniref:DUF305 domain-containing protein n=1 Tax=Methylibium sp. TaxID=2067992 RepID=UPI002DBD13A3|nr:DUF305 domain-containing protein [Methylibium sp.]HEU4459542.1 DUF305 domain-containing protein [Methylibium sp.]